MLTARLALCNTCRHGEHVTRQVPTYPSLGAGSGTRDVPVVECRRYPETVDKHHEDWCGEWRKR